MALKSCYECHAEVSDRADSCPKCGAPFNLPAPAQVVPLKSKGTAAALAIFLGGIGIHKFYIGRPGWGVIYILFCWTFIPAILGLIEGLSYLTESPARWQKRFTHS